MGVTIAQVQQAAPTSTGTQDYTVSGFGTPKAALFIVTKATTNGTAADEFVLGFGATDGTRTWSIGAESEHGQSSVSTSSSSSSVSSVSTSSSSSSISTSSSSSSISTSSVSSSSVSSLSSSSSSSSSSFVVSLLFPVLTETRIFNVLITSGLPRD